MRKLARLAEVGHLRQERIHAPHGRHFEGRGSSVAFASNRRAVNNAGGRCGNQETEGTRSGCGERHADETEAEEKDRTGKVTASFTGQRPLVAFREKSELTQGACHANSIADPIPVCVFPSPPRADALREALATAEFHINL